MAATAPPAATGNVSNEGTLDLIICSGGGDALKLRAVRSDSTFGDLKRRIEAW
jgi:hypothetical protein